MSVINLPVPGKDDPRYYIVYLPAPYGDQEEWEYVIAWSTPGGHGSIYVDSNPTNTKWARERIKDGILRWRVGVLDYDRGFVGGWRYFEVTDEPTIRQVLQAAGLE